MRAGGTEEKRQAPGESSADTAPARLRPPPAPPPPPAPTLAPGLPRVEGAALGCVTPGGVPAGLRPSPSPPRPPRINGAAAPRGRRVARSSPAGAQGRCAPPAPLLPDGPRPPGRPAPPGTEGSRVLGRAGAQLRGSRDAEGPLPPGPRSPAQPSGPPSTPSAPPLGAPVPRPLGVWGASAEPPASLRLRLCGLGRACC